MAYNNDNRWVECAQKFVAGLLGAAEGLTEDQKNIFQHGWLNMITEQQARGMGVQQGIENRQRLV
jgi:hypothetical protein